MTGKPEVELPAQGRLAGIDFGTVRIGVALSDPGQSIASPFEIYVRRSPANDAMYFKQLAIEQQLVGFVVGLPVHMSGDESQKSIQAKAFGAWLKTTTGLSVGWIDERFSTAMARQVLAQSNLSAKKKKAQLDKLAAQILLTAYLESHAPDRSTDAIDE